MKRTEMILIIAECLIEPPFGDFPLKEAEDILKKLETLGMQPPWLNPDKCHVLNQIYIQPYFNMWDEEFDSNPELVEALKRRLERKKK